MNKDKEQNVASIVTDLNKETKFAETARINCNPDGIILEFLQKSLDNNMAQEDLEKIKKMNENIDKVEYLTSISRVALTWPHFVRFVKMINRVYNNNKDEAFEEMKKLVDMGDGDAG